MGAAAARLAWCVCAAPSCAQAGVPLAAAETLDGTSLVPLLRDPTLTMLPSRGWALSQYPRCPAEGDDPAEYYKHNKCEFIERSKIPFMGYSLRVDTWRYTEWVRWNGSALRPIWEQPVGVEMYAHDAGNASKCNTASNACFDGFENKNLASLSCFS